MTQRTLTIGMMTLLLSFGPCLRAEAQVKEGFDDRTLPEEHAPQTRQDTLQQLHLIHVTPRVLVFDAATRSATLVLSNTGDQPLQGDVLILFAYPDWPHSRPADTTVITPHMEWLVAHDTIINHPDPTAPFAGRWLSGLPTRVIIPPHQTKRVVVRITPPPDLPTGEYWARVVVAVNPHPSRGKGQDERQRYAVPASAPLPVLHDSVLVFYRQGAVHAGLTFGAHPEAAVDQTGYGGPDGRDCPRSLWIRLPLHLTGPAHVDGTLLVTYTNVATGEVIPVNKFPLSLYRDAVTHWWTHTCWLPLGTYRATVWFESTQPEVPAAQRLPVAPVQVTIPTPFVVSQY